MTISKSNLVWVDCEMTGLDAHLRPLNSKVDWEADRIIEIAIIVTDADLNPLDEGIEFIIKTDLTVLNKMGEWCTAQHARTGLTAACQSSDAMEMRKVDELCRDYVGKHFPEGFTMCLLAGSSVGQDKIFIQKDLPLLFSRLHYRILDVSSFKELANRWCDLPIKPAYESDHRARSDILASIEELKFYRKHMIVPRKVVE